MFEVVHLESSNEINYDLGTNLEMRCVYFELMALFLQQVYGFFSLSTCVTFDFSSGWKNLIVMVMGEVPAFSRVFIYFCSQTQ